MLTHSAPIEQNGWTHSCNT